MLSVPGLELVYLFGAREHRALYIDPCKRIGAVQ